MDVIEIAIKHAMYIQSLTLNVAEGQIPVYIQYVIKLMV